MSLDHPAQPLGFDETPLALTGIEAGIEAEQAFRRCLDVRLREGIGAQHADLAADRQDGMGEAAQIDPADITAGPGKPPGPAVHLFQNRENLAAQDLVIHGTGR